MTQLDRRQSRALEAPVVDGLPDLPGILAAMSLSPTLGAHLRGLADVLLVDEFPGATVSRGERELLATAVSLQNECVFCADSHAAFASELLRREQGEPIASLTDRILDSGATGVSKKMAALLQISRQVAREPLRLERSQVDTAVAAGASAADVKLAILIAAAFCMYNRMVDGLRAHTPADPGVYAATAQEIAERGYAGTLARSE